MLRNVFTIFIFGIIAMIISSCNPEEKSSTKESAKSNDNEIDFSLNQTNFGDRIFSSKDLYSTKRITEFVTSPDGEWIVYRQSTPSIAENKLFSDLFAVKIDGSETTQLTNNKSSESNIRFSNDGKKLYFISTEGDTPQIYVMDFPKGTPKKISDLEKGVGTFNIEGESDFIALSSEVKIAKTLKEEYPEFDKANMMIFDELPIRHWDEWTDEYVSHIFSFAQNTAKDIMDGETYESPLKPWGGAEEYAISPEASEIAYTCKKVDNYAVSTNSDIYLYNISDGATKNITDGMMGYEKMPKYSPDGKYIAFTSQERAGFEADRVRLMLYNRETSEISEISKTLDQWVEDFVWTPDSKAFYLIAGNKGTDQVYFMDISGNWELITNGIHKISGGLNITKDGKTLIFGKQTFSEPLDIYSMNLDDRNINQITNINKELYANIQKVNVEERWFKATDGKDFQAWVIYPPNFDPNKKYPLITYCQGGPQSMISPNFHYRWNQYLMASEGYIMLAPNRRGLPGFGQDWNDAISLDWGGMAMSDLLAATDQFSEEPFVDKDARAAMGASAGGYAAFWLAGHHNKRFKAFISHCGVFNLVSMYGSTEELFFPNWEYGGPYWDMKNRPNYQKNSPHAYVQNWDTPILISTGMNDFRVPYTQSLEAFTAARAQNIPAEIIVFPNETHFISRPQEFLIWNDQVFKFLDKYCKK